MRIILAVALATSCCCFLPGGNGENVRFSPECPERQDVGSARDETIGYCENIESPNLPPNWLGATSTVLGYLNVPGADALGYVFNLIFQFGPSFDWNQYACDLGQCVEAMIEVAITDANLNSAKAARQLIANEQGNLLKAFLDDLDDGPDLDSDSVVIKEIEGYIRDIEDGLGDIHALFLAEVNRPELFTDYVLDAVIQADTISKFAVVAAYKCKGVPQDIIDGVQKQYRNSLDQNIVDVISGGSTSLKNVLDNSEFSKWGTRPSDYIRQERPIVCDDDGPSGSAQDCGGGPFECSIYDDYRMELEVSRIHSNTGCCGTYDPSYPPDQGDQCYEAICEDGSECVEDDCEWGGGECCLVEAEFGQCDGFEADALYYASTAYEDMMKDIDEAGEFIQKMRIDIDAVATYPLEDFPGLCDYLDQQKGEK